MWHVAVVPFSCSTEDGSGLIILKVSQSTAILFFSLVWLFRGHDFEEL